MSADPKPDWQPPERFGEYTLVRPLGRGQSGLVFVAHDTLLDRHVAVKFIAARDQRLLAQFVLEARAAARIQHPNVATLYRVGELDGHAYLVWELVRGTALDQLARPVPADRVIRIATDVARGLAAAHRRGVLHRDVKPANIVVADTGEAKVVDFGLAALLDVVPGSGAALDQPTPTPVTAERDVTAAAAAASGSGTASPSRLDPPVIGTPYFRSPEAWRGEPLDARSDLYSVGLVLYELLAGEGPFRHLRIKELGRVIQDERPRPLRAAAPGVPEGLAAVVDRCLRLEREARYPSADDLLAALELLSPRRAAAIPEGNPYRGLRAYGPEHRAVFFGRGRALQLALERLRGESLIVVIGDSGVGKSSLCAAGIVPAIADGALEDGRRWLVGRTVPGRTPLRNLGEALARATGGDAGELARDAATDPGDLGRRLRARLHDELGLVLYVDQLEELVTLAPAAEAAATAEAIAALGDGVPGVRVLATARSDFLSRLAGLPGLAERLSAAILLLGPMADGEVREAIVGPATLKGGQFESSALVDELVASATAAQGVGGSLPLLQFTLAELWERRDATTGTIAASSLAAIGGVAGALARHADGTLIALSPADRVVARAVLLRLVTIDGTRARRTEEELRAVAPGVPAVLEALVRGRLLVVGESPDGATYEIAHEALVAGWRTLADWLAEEGELRAARHRLEVAATEWHRLRRSRELLWSARQLAELDPRVLDGLAPRELAFLDASRAARQRARWLRRGAIAAVALALAGAWAAAAIVKRREVAAQVDDALATGERTWIAARTALASGAAARAIAFAAWDRRDPAAADRAWADVQRDREAAHRYLAATAGHFERALLLDASRGDVRDHYGDLLLDRLLLAEDERARAEIDELTVRLALHDRDGARRAWLATPATLEVDVDHAEARLVLARYDRGAPADDDADPKRSARAGAATDRPLEVELTPGAPAEVPAGAWLLTITAPGRAPLRQSLYLERGEREHHRLHLPARREVPRGFVYIPAGEGLFGSSDPEAVRAWFNAVPLHVVSTPAYLIAAHETTFRDWIAFLNALPGDEVERRRPHVAGTGFRGTLELRQAEDGTWELAFQPTDHLLRARAGQRVRYADRDRRREQDWLRMPVSGISYDDAVAYTVWLAHSGRLRTARLCTEHEWERAARGTADRKFPHGDTLAPDDANVDETYGKRPGGFGPDEVGSHPASDSPFGVSDLSGNVWEWVRSSVAPGEVVARGGSYFFAANTARIANRELPEPSYRDLTVGLRICADAPE